MAVRWFLSQALPHLFSSVDAGIPILTPSVFCVDSQILPSMLSVSNRGSSDLIERTLENPRDDSKFYRSLDKLDLQKSSSLDCGFHNFVTKKKWE